MRWFNFTMEHSPRWHLRIGRLVVQWWPSEPSLRKLEVVWLKGAKP